MYLRTKRILKNISPLQEGFVNTYKKHQLEIGAVSYLLYSV